MYCVIYWSLSPTPILLVYGPFVTMAQAEAYIAAKVNPGNFYAATVWSKAPVFPGGNLVQTAVFAGQFATAQVALNASGIYNIFLYGAFASDLECQAWIAAKDFPGNYYSSVVQPVV